MTVTGSFFRKTRKGTAGLLCYKLWCNLLPPAWLANYDCCVPNCTALCWFCPFTLGRFLLVIRPDSCLIWIMKLSVLFYKSQTYNLKRIKLLVFFIFYVVNVLCSFFKVRLLKPCMYFFRWAFILKVAISFPGVMEARLTDPRYC